VRETLQRHFVSLKYEPLFLSFWIQLIVFFKTNTELGRPAIVILFILQLQQSLGE
jgi:hypothetical protein